MMKNMEQIRAKNALAYANKIGAGKNEGKAVAKKVPTMIMENGIIATAAFAKETGKGYEDVFKAVIAHLSDPEVARLSGIQNLDEFIKYLTEKIDSVQLRQITAETMAYLNYLRRFAN